MEHDIVIVAIKSLEFLFMAGLVGSAVLILLTSVEDVYEVLSKVEEPEPVAQEILS